MMHDCLDITMRESLPELAHDALPERDAVRVREHLAGCIDCATELAIIRAAIAVSEASHGISGIAARVDVARIAAAIPPYRRGSSTDASADASADAHTGSRADSPVRSRFAAGRLPPLPPLQRVMQIAAVALIGAIGVSVAVAHHDAAPATVTTAAHAASAMLPASAASGVALIGTADVSDAHLAQLINDLDHLDAVPPAEPEPVTPVALENSGGGA